MTRFVLDCSVAMAWCFQDEVDEYADAVLEKLTEAPAVAPSLWPLEIANVLLVAERHGRVTVAHATRFLELLRSYPIEVDVETHVRAFGPTIALGREHGLSAYDGAYLELAMRLDLPLASRDQALIGAGERCGVSLFSV